MPFLKCPRFMRESHARMTSDGCSPNAWPFVADLPDAIACNVAKRRTGPPAFQERHLQRTVELWRLFTAIAREKKPDNIYYGNLAGASTPRPI